jgi:hypothetical protein
MPGAIISMSSTTIQAGIECHSDNLQLQSIGQHWLQYIRLLSR